MDEQVQSNRVKVNPTPAAGMMSTEQAVHATQNIQQPKQPVQQQAAPQTPPQTKATPETKMPISPNVEFKPTDVDPKDKVPPTPEEHAIDLDALIREHAENVESGRSTIKNAEHLSIAVPLSELDALEEAKAKDLAKDPAMIGEKLSDMLSLYTSLERAQQMFAHSFQQLVESLKHIQGDLTEKLKRSYGGVGDADATVSSKFRGKDRIELTDADAFMAMATMTGGMRRVTLWNSGFSITLRKLPLTLLNAYYQMANTTDYQYGKQFGAFYYLFADLLIKQHIIEYLIPAAICTSNYAHWRDPDKLLSAISLQDFPTILWAMGCMMHPNGANVHFVCGEPNCGHAEQVNSDLTKLRLLNTDLINDEMVAHFKQPGLYTDEMLQNYRKICNLNKPIELEYGEGLGWRKWKFNLRQISLADHIDVGKDFNADLQRTCHIDRRAEVTDYTTYNLYRTYKPWIESLEMTYKHGETEQTIVLNNSGTEETDKAVYLTLETIQQEAPEFDKMMQDYITDTAISHIAFYMPKCPACGAEPKVGYHGYIPYDAMRNFFTLALMKLLQGASARSRTTS